MNMIRDISPSDIQELRRRLGLTQAQFGELLNVQQSTVSRWERGTRPEGDERERLLELVSKHQGASPLHTPLFSGNPPVVTKEHALLGEVARAEVLPPAISAMTKDVPVYGTAHGGQGGDFEMNGQLIDYARRPPGIAGSKTVFCVYVQGDSMAPWRQPGELVYLNPDRPARPGDYVVVELQGENGEPAPALLKRLVSVSVKELTLEQFNPAKRDIKISRNKVKRIIRVIDWMELLGI